MASASARGCALGASAATSASRTTPTLCVFVNATGVVLHTNLGRAPLAALAAIRTEGHPDPAGRLGIRQGLVGAVKYALETLKNVYKIWQRPVHLETVVFERRKVLTEMESKALLAAGFSLGGNFALRLALGAFVQVLRAASGSRGVDVVPVGVHAHADGAPCPRHPG